MQIAPSTNVRTFRSDHEKKTGTSESTGAKCPHRQCSHRLLCYIKEPTTTRWSGSPKRPFERFTNTIFHACDQFWMVEDVFRMFFSMWLCYLLNLRCDCGRKFAVYILRLASAFYLKTFFDHLCWTWFHILAVFIISSFSGRGEIRHSINVGEKSDLSDDFQKSKFVLYKFFLVKLFTA